MHRGGLDRDRAWVEEHVLGEGDLLLYGRLAEELDDIPPAELWKELRAAAEPYLAGGEDRTAILQRKVDAMIEALVARDQRFGYPPPFCHKGCSNCCHELVYCTDEEARQIHEHCRAAGLAIDYARIARQLQHVATDEHLDHTGGTTWNTQAELDQACVFLDPADGSCTIWPARPLVCRAHLAEQTDQYCRPRNGVVNPKALGINYLELSYSLSAIFTIHRASIRKTMGRLLLELNAGPGPREEVPPRG
jgi:Fe-S-cluster containining protein